MAKLSWLCKDDPAGVDLRLLEKPLLGHTRPVPFADWVTRRPEVSAAAARPSREVAMDLATRIAVVFRVVDDFVVAGWARAGELRQRGPAPILAGSEVVPTVEITGEFLGPVTNRAVGGLHVHFRRHFGPATCSPARPAHGPSTAPPAGAKRRTWGR